MDPELEGLSETALRARHEANAARYGEIMANPDRTIVEAREARTLALENNGIVEALGESATIPGIDPLPALPIVEVPVAPVATAVSTETMVEGQEVQMAEAIAASAALGNTVNATAADATAAITAGVTRVTQRAVEPGAPVVALPRVGKTIQAAASHGSITVGAPLTLGQIGEAAMAIAMDKGRQGSNQPIVNVLSDRPAVMQASAKAGTNTAALNEYLRGEGPSITADAFDPCGPPDILRDVPECLNTESYVTNWFRTVPSEHGAIEFYTPLGMADVANSTTVWGQSDQNLVDADDTDTWKPCATIGCLPTVTVGVEEIVQCLCMPVFNHMTSPEVVGSAMAAMRAVLARTRDGHLLDLYDELSSAYTYNATTQNLLGATIDIYDLLGRLLGMTAAANRELDLSAYTLAVEAGFMAHLNLDNQMACNPRAAQEAAQSLFGSLGIGTIAVTPDWSITDGNGPYSAFLPINPPGEVAIALPARPTSWKLRLFAPSDFAMLSPGTEDLGIVPDLNSKRQNKLCWFGATWQGLAKLGCRPAYNVEISGLAATGARAACV